MGVHRPSDMLFVTDVFQEAVAARAAGNLLFIFETCGPRSYFGARFSALIGFFYSLVV